MTDMDLQQAQIKDSKSISFIWLLPVIALIIGGWLLVKTLIEAPIKISISFSSGTGIEPGKTKVIYEGITIGLVTDVRLDETDLKGVTVIVEMDRRTEPMLKDSTQFWLVKPEISLSGVTGLETIVTGNYIGLKIGTTGKKSIAFNALSEAPVLGAEVPGLHLELLSKDLGALHKDSPVVYKKITVGSVIHYALESNQDQVRIRIHIEPEYAHLVTKNSRFWNVSGIQVDADLSGIRVHTDSLATVLKGGLTFDAPGVSESNPMANNGDEYTLYSDYSAAERGIIATIQFAVDESIKESTPILFKGFPAGKVTSVAFNDNRKQIMATVQFHPNMEPYLSNRTRFWVVKPELSLQGLGDINTLLSGAHIEMDGATGDAVRDFTALKHAPAVDYSRPGLHLKLQADERGSLTRGAPVLYRKVEVGSVTAVSLNKARNKVEIDITIKPEFADLVHSTSRFWNASGISINGSLSKVTFRAESLASIVQGGIAFYNPGSASKLHKVANGEMFTLYPDFDMANLKGTQIRIHLNDSDGIKEGTLIKYHGFPVGEINRIELKSDLSGITAHAILKHKAEKFAVASSRFWLVKPELGIAGAANLETLLNGQYFEVLPGSGNQQFEFTAETAPRQQTVLRDGLNLTLKASRLGSIKQGVNIFYRDVVVGQVTGYELSELGNEVNIFVNIKSPFNKLVRSNTQFWNASGVNINVGLFKGASIKTESLESVLAGGISFATPTNGNEQPTAKSGAFFPLHSEAQPEWLNWAPKIPLR